jgi:cation-transporting ATPase I
VRNFLPLRAFAMGIQTTSALASASVSTAATAAGALGSFATAGIDIVTLPAREGAKVLSRAVSQPTLGRHCWSGDSRAWIEVRGLDGEYGRELGRAVLDAVRTHTGVTSASLNYPLSRVVVSIGADDTSLRDLCRVVDDAEKRFNRATKRGADRAPAARPKSLPGDGLVMVSTVAAAGANAAGLAFALAGRALRLPRFPFSVQAAVAVVDYQPRLRRLLEDRLGKPATDTVLSVAMAAANTIAQAPAALTVDLTMEVLKTAESRAQARAWIRHEPKLAQHADHPSVHSPARRVAPADGPVERYATRSAFVQGIGVALVGAATRSVRAAGTAALVAVPKATRTTRESFAAKLGQGLADQHAVLPLRRDSLRRLDQVDALVIDPRVLRDNKLRVVRLRGAGEGELSKAWTRAQDLLDDSDLQPGWHPVPGGASGVEAQICAAHHPLASAVVTEARNSGLDLISVDTDDIGELRPAFDEIRPLENGAIDEALAQAVAAWQMSGHTVAVLSSVGAQALSSADLAVGVMPNNDTDAPPWHADLILADLAGAWRILHALPAAKAASKRGVEISAAASGFGALFMLPGVRGRGPGPVTSGAAAGLFSGYMLARRVVQAPTPRPAPVHEWHTMSVEQVRKMLSSADSDEPAEQRQRSAQLAGGPPHGVWQFVHAVRAELADPLTGVLALGSAASAVLGSPLDAMMIGSVLTGNSILAASQRLRAESKLNQLLAQQIPPARKVTTRPGDTPMYIEVIAEHLQPGDVIEVRTHEVVPADARVIEAEDVEVDESTLTGESLPVAKQVEATPGAPLPERRCMLYAGTTVVTGTVVALVTAVGPDTQVRRAAQLVSTDLPEIGLQHQLGQLTKRAFPVTLAGGGLVSLFGLLHRRGLRQAVANGIAVAVTAVPEGMPLVATLAQQASAHRLTNFGALTRVPRSVEALGRVDVVCFDKTGTLSENRLRVAQVQSAPAHSREEVLRCAAHAAPISNSGPQIHATDNAIIEAAKAVNGSTLGPGPVAHLPFRSGRSFSASVSGIELTVKGAPEVVLGACQDAGADVYQTVAQLAADGLRVIAVAQRQLSPQQAKSVQEDPDAIADLCAEGLSLTGLLGLSDTPRAQARELLAKLREHMVDIRLITGDHPITAKAIANELGMPVTAEQVISGTEWDALSRKDQERAVTERVVFARMSPENKVQIVQTLERTGRVSAMVGDGANDAAAIRAATVGIGVSAGGSDPARIAADVVLIEGRIEALVHAIEEGRRLWRRVQAAASVLLGGNAAQMAFAVIGSAITGGSPLNTRQLLLANMATDALPAAALAVSMPTDSVRSDTHVLDERALWRAVGMRGATTATATTAAWAMASVTGLPRRASTVALIAFVTAQLGQTLVESHDRLVVVTAVGSLAVMATLISTPGVSQLVGCTPLGPLGWAQGLGAAAAATVAGTAANRFVAGRRPSEPDLPAEPELPATEIDSTLGPSPSDGDGSTRQLVPRVCGHVSA